MALGAFSMFEGLALVSNNGRAINPSNTTTSYFTLISAKILGVVPVVAIVFVLLTVILHFVLHRTRFGYRVQAVGSNPDAALLAGIPNALVRLQTPVLMGAIAVLVRFALYRLSWSDRSAGRVRLRAHRDCCGHHRRHAAFWGVWHCVWGNGGSPVVLSRLNGTD